MNPIRIGIDANEVRQRAGHVLYVEGRKGFDREVIDTLLAQNDVLIEVRELGPSQHVRAAAEALHPHQPMSYFLVDRDHFRDEDVEKSWANFPDPNTYNLLMWKKKELENYFLNPELLCRLPVDSADVQRRPKATEAALKKSIEKQARDRVWFDIANATIISFREELRANWIKSFDKPSKLTSRTAALNELLRLKNFEEHRVRVGNALASDAVEARFNEIARRFLGTTKEPTWGKGLWLDLISGKELFAALVNEFFVVEERSGKQQVGDARILSVARRLVSMPLKDLPKDLRELVSLIKQRVES